MRLISSIISLDVEIERVETRGRAIVLLGFAGVHDMEAHVDAAEAWQLCRLILRPSIIGLLIKAIVVRA
ncbi:MAG TPA: hypothetical protein PKD48_03610 [Sphingopyxis sp.]|nr:hypothetical protein [Sphingopyxis sp.]HMQ18881.1 hypothetical protein [Sphingopyxis sp.]